MKLGFLRKTLFVTMLLCQFSICHAGEKLDPDDPNRYLNAVREFADNVLKYGRDTYGPKHTPLFVDGLMVRDPNNPDYEKDGVFKPVEWIAPNGDRWILSNLASQQNLFRTLDGLTRITGDPKYKQAAMDAIKYAFENLRTPNGLLYWGGHAAYDARADRPCGSRDNHELKSCYPYYELMWEVDPQATKQFIEAFWSAHILDWANLEMNRHGSLRGALKKPWDYEYNGGPVFFEGKGISFSSTGNDLSYGAAILSKLSGEKVPLDWAKRLSHRYVDTRFSNVGISSYTYNRNIPSPLQDLLGDDFKRDLLVYGMEFPAYWNLLDTPSQIYRLLLGEILGDESKEFTQWAIEELTAWGKVAYRKEDNSFIPMLIDGTNLEGYVLKKNSDCGPKGTVVKSTPAGSSVFFVYALAYCRTENNFMWEMARNIAKGNNFGDIGKTLKDKPQLCMSTDCSDFYVLIGFLELFKKTKTEAFLNIAERVGDNILLKRFHNGFFVPSAKHIYTSFNVIDSLSLLHLDAIINSRSMLMPEVWPSWYYFEGEYRRIGMQRDEEIIYPLTDSVEPPILLFEAAAMGDFDLVKSLVSSGADVNAAGPAFHSAPLHEAVKGNYINIVKLLISNGVDVNAKGGSYRLETALHQASERGFMNIAKLLIIAGADVNANDSLGGTSLQYAAYADNKDIIDLLLQKGAKIANLYIASYIGDLEKAESFINEGVDINTLDGHGYAPLHYAALNNQKKAAERLIAKGADANVKNWAGQTPIYIAISRGRKDITDWLICHGADVNTTDNTGNTILHYAAKDGQADIAELLIKKGAHIDAKNNDGKTPLDIALGKNRNDIVKLLVSKGACFTSLHMAAQFGTTTSVQALLEKGINIDLKDDRGRTPLYYAVRFANKDVAETLIAKGADVNVTFKNDYPLIRYATWNEDIDTVGLLVGKGLKFDVKDRDGSTAFRDAALQGSQDIVEFFVSKGVQIPPLHLTACMGDISKLKNLIEQGADINTKDEFGWTPLYWATSMGRTETVELLVSKGANINAKNNLNETPLHQAIKAGNKELAEFLIANGADINAKNKYARMPLYSAVYRGDVYLSDLLLKKGADLESSNTGGCAALLDQAVSHGNIEIIEWLINNGADVNRPGGSGQTPLHSAARRGDVNIVKLLISRGAKIQVLNKFNRTPLDIAVSQGHAEIVELLRKHGAKE